MAEDTKAKRGRPTVGPQKMDATVAAPVPTGVYQRLQAEAHARNQSIAAVVRRIVTAHVSKGPAGPTGTPNPSTT
jgi:hypothetical protein